jgi:hypothetical protein
MLANENNYMAFNNFSEMPDLPYKIIEVLLTDTSQDAEDFWKLLKYTEVNALKQKNLTLKEKKAMIWQGESIEQNFNVFLKPLIGSAMDSAEAQTQLRLYRYNTVPTTQFEAIVCFEADFVTNEKTSLVRRNKILCERTDVMEALFLSVMNGRDIEIGSGVFQFNRELSRSCNSQLNIGNSKSFYGRSLILALQFVGADSGGGCG